MVLANEDQPPALRIEPPVGVARARPRRERARRTAGSEARSAKLLKKIVSPATT